VKIGKIEAMVLYSAGFSLSEIGRMGELTRQRVHQLLPADLPRRPVGGGGRGRDILRQQRERIIR